MADQIDSPRVAVVVPCFNDGALIREAVSSISESEPVEVIVIDDASDDPESRRMCEQLGEEGAKVVLLDRNVGLGAARMRGVAVALAPYVFSLDSDDLAVPGMLGAMADRLDLNPEAGACYGDWEEFGTEDRSVPVPPRIDPYRLAYNDEYPPAAMYRRNVLERTGGWAPPAGFDRPLSGYEDWHLWMSIAERSIPAIYMGPGVVTYRRRLHGTRLLHHARANHRTYYRSLRRLHPELFAARSANRSQSDLSPLSRRRDR